MQYVGQTGRSLKTRFREHFSKMKKPKNDTFLYRHCKNNGHSPSKIILQMVENIIYDPNSSSRFINIKRHETELKWIKFLQSPFSFRFLALVCGVFCEFVTFPLVSWVRCGT